MVHNHIGEITGGFKTKAGRIDTKGLIEKIESGYIAHTKSGFKVKKSFSPSSLVYGHGACPRYWFFAFSGADYVDDVTTWQAANMRSGTFSHERIQQAIGDSGILIENETKMTYDNPPMLGYRDSLVMWNGEEVAVEIKTCNDNSFEARKNSRKALPYHIEQLLMYMRIGGQKIGVIIYENKNTHELLAIPVEMDAEYEEWLDKLFAWMETVYSAWEAGELPKKKYRSNSKVCAACPLKNHCDYQDAFGVDIPVLEHL